MAGLSALRTELTGLFTERRISVVVFGASLAIHSWIVLSVILPTNIHTIAFKPELITFVAIAALLDGTLFVVQKITAYRVLFLIRFGVVLIAAGILGTQDVNLSILLTSTLFIDIVVYDAGIIARLIATAAAITIVGAQFYFQRHEMPWTAVSFIADFTITIGLIVGFAAAAMYYREDVVKSERRIKNLETTVTNLTDANKAFQLYADNIESESAEKERNRITSELHDTIGYTLTNVIVMMKAGTILLDENPAALADVLKRVGEQSEFALNDIRQTLHKMKAIRQTDVKGLKAIYALTKAFQGATGITVEVNHGNMPWSLGQRVDSVLFRLVQEGLTNAFRHGHASEVSVFFWRTADEIRVVVRDNGRGADALSPKSDGMGLSGIRERLAELGGVLTARNRDVGFEIDAAIPYRIGEIGGTNQSAHS